MKFTILFQLKNEKVHNYRILSGKAILISIHWIQNILMHSKFMICHYVPSALQYDMCMYAI